jgi:hypothetical protein
MKIGRLSDSFQLPRSQEPLMKRRTPLRVNPFEDRLVPAPLTGGSPIVTDITFLSPPALSSLPGAAAKIYLDFDGNHESDWFIKSGTTEYHYSDVVTPAFDTDGHPGWFTGTEMGQMTDVWKRVAEDFAPFNIDVTTIDPGDFSDKKGLHVVIGGSDSDWLGLGTSGISSIGSFSDSAPNVVFVFSKDIASWSAAGLADGDGTPIEITPAVATTASHESGHSFGLLHQSVWVGGILVEQYNPGSSDRTPIMGNNLCSDRTTWYNGKSVTGMIQSDMPTIASAANGFGYRLDSDNTFGTATSLVSSGGKLSGSGIVSTTIDKDYYRFDTTGGMFTFTAAVADVGPNLDVRLELWTHKPAPTPGDPFGFADTLIAWSDPSLDLNASFTSILESGTYYLVVRSHGTYGDVGQYTLTVEPFFFPGKTFSAGGAVPGRTSGEAFLTLDSRQISPGAATAGPQNAKGSILRRAEQPGQLASGATHSAIGVASSNGRPSDRLVLDSPDDGTRIDVIRGVAGSLPALYPH